MGAFSGFKICFYEKLHAACYDRILINEVKISDNDYRELKVHSLMLKFITLPAQVSGQAIKSYGEGTTIDGIPWTLDFIGGPYWNRTNNLLIKSYTT